jgi:hypothetical protein
VMRASLGSTVFPRSKVLRQPDDLPRYVGIDNKAIE